MFGSLFLTCDNNLQAFFVLPHTLFVGQAIKRSAVVLARFFCGWGYGGANGVLHFYE
jgi:hypothetical protein